MSDPFVAEIRILPLNFAPRGWASCDGYLMPISQNTALFSLLGTTYGGDGKSTFGLPDLQGRIPMQAGQGPGLMFHELGEKAGTETVTLLQTEMPMHNHTAACLDGARVGQQTGDPTNASLVKASGDPAPNAYISGVNPNAQLFPTALSFTGAGMPHNNMMPYLALNFCIALQGIYPSRG